MDHSKDAEETQSNSSTNLIQMHFSSQINKQVNFEQMRSYNELNSYAKNESHLLQHPLRSFSMPHKKQHNEPKDHKMQTTDLSSKYLEVASFIKQPNEEHDAFFKKHGDKMQKESSIMSIPKAFPGSMLNNKNEVSDSHSKGMTEFNMSLTTDMNTAEALMQNNPVNEENYCNIAVTSTSENSLNEHNVERLKENAMFQKSCEANQLLHSSHSNEFNVMNDHNSQKTVICSNKVLKVDEMEISETIAKSRTDFIENNNHMTKKQLQIRMSRSCGEPNGNCPLENILINDQDHVRVKTRIHEVNIGAPHDGIFFDKPKVSEKINKAHHLLNDNNWPLKITQEIDAETTTDKVEVKTPDKIRFEEIENKLEEMFAGIEDEQLVHPTNSKNNYTTCFNKIGGYELDDMKLHAVTKKCSGINTNVVRDEVLIAKVCYENVLQLPINSSHPTKAAKKSTNSCILETNKIEAETAKFTTDTERFQKSIPPHRRLSLGIDPSLFRISFESQTDINRNKNQKIIDKESTLNRNKIKKNSKDSCAENKREITYSKSLISNNKRKKFKSYGQGSAAKQKQQTLKQRSIQTTSLDNDNDPEERTQQPREDNKIRSPFILVKQDGAITVVNAPTIDDLNEKNTKAKKTGTFVHERKNVRGCHSSTLSNRYDADTADSTWICAFCKQGPHKKGLGDLFGPYIVSKDCEEYQSAIDVYINNSASLYIKHRRIETSLGTEKALPRHANDAVIDADISAMHDVSDCNAEPSLHKFSLGMSRISETGFEIWLHEDCAIWAPNLFVIGSRLVGLEAAIWNSTRYKCEFCSKPGAILCCLERQCKITAHVPCAREFYWSLDELKFWSHCKKHVSKMISTSLSN